MNAQNFSVAALAAMAHSPVRNYVVPGLTSWLIGEPSEHGTVRMFVSEREHQETITPHSHRFAFQCWVLAGSVRNRLWTSRWSAHDADVYMQSRLTYKGGIGKYERSEVGTQLYSFIDQTYSAGECYSMTAAQIHSIWFSRGARVLFFEGPTTEDSSMVLEPFVDGETVPTLEVKPWMFKRGAAPKPTIARTICSASD